MSNSHFQPYFSNEEKDAELLRSAKELVYWNYNGVELKAYAVGEMKPGEKRPALIFLHDGMWDKSQPAQFIPHCHHFTESGALCFSVEYRVADKDMLSPLDAVEDARNIVTWVRDNAANFGVDTAKIVLIGAGSGAHAALCTSLREAADPKKGKLLSEPDALVLFSPVVDTTAKGVAHDLFEDPKVAEKTSPSKNIRVKRPPMMIMHSKADRLVPHEQVSKFVRKVNWWRNRCKFIEVEGQPHAFFNFNFDQQMFLSAVGEMADFLVSQKIIEDPNWDVQGEIVD